VLIAASAAQSQPNQELPARLLREAPKKWEEYRARARKMQGEYTMTFTTIQPNAAKTVRTDTFQQNATSAVIVWGHTKLLNGDPLKVNMKSTVWGQNPLYSFQLTREDPGKPWVGAALDIGNKKPLLLGPIIDRAVWSVTPQFRANLLKPIAEVLSENGFLIQQVSPVDAEGGKLVRLDFVYKERVDSEIRTRTGWVTMDPAQYWHITEANINTMSKDFEGQYHVKYEFTRGKGDLPIIKRSIDKVEGNAIRGGQQLRNSLVEWVIREDDMVPDANFKLSAFGLPEPMEMTEASTSRSYLWCYGLALGLFSVAGICKFLNKRGFISAAT
jgi:hypothetical protein